MALLAVLAGCAAPPASGPAPTVTAQPDKLNLRAVAFADLPGWQRDDVGAALPALQRSCAKLTANADDRPVGPDGLAGRVADWRPVCQRLAGLAGPALRALLEAEFQPLQAVGRDGAEGLFTGYYEMALRGARKPDSRYRTPLYRRPEDLVQVELGDFRADWKGERIAGKVVDGRLRPYPARAEIEAGALAGRGLELLWVEDPNDALFLSIQGSGLITLADGGRQRVGYAAQNGHAYYAIGRKLIERGVLTPETVSLASIRAWLAAHPDEAPALRAFNPSYVFFREIAGDGPIGAQGTVLVPGRSLAVDPKFLPLGVPLWLDAALEDEPDGRLRRLVVAQDTGGAIRGPVRGDMFWGTGAEAERRAGPMKARGGYYLLLPRSVAARLAPVS